MSFWRRTVSKYRNKPGKIASSDIPAVIPLCSRTVVYKKRLDCCKNWRCFLAFLVCSGKLYSEL